MTTTGEVLKPCPCPWCASPNIATQPDDAQGTKWGYAYCADCGVRGPEVRTGYKMADDAPWRWDAIVAWNDRRAPQGNAAQEDSPVTLNELTDLGKQIVKETSIPYIGLVADLKCQIAKLEAALAAAAPSNKEVER